MLERMHRNRALRHLRVPVTGVALAFRVGPVSGLAHEVDGVLANLGLVAVALGIDAGVEVANPQDHRVRIVDRHRPSRDRGSSEQALGIAILPQRRGVSEVRQDGVVGSDPHIVAPALGGDVHHAVRGGAKVVLGDCAPGFGELHPDHAGMEEHRVHRIHHVLVQLQPVARMPEGEGNQAVVGLIVGVEVRERGDGPRRSHVREDETGELAGRVRPLGDGVPDGALGRLTGSLEDHPVHVEQPAVVAAANPALRHDAELQRRAAMAAVPVQDPDPAIAIAKHDEVLAQDPHRQGNVAQLRGERDRLPVAAKQLASRSPGADMGKLLVDGGYVRQGMALIGARTPIGRDVHGCMRP